MTIIPNTVKQLLISASQIWTSRGSHY